MGRKLLILFLIRAFMALFLLVSFSSPAQAQFIDDVGGVAGEVRDYVGGVADEVRDHACETISTVFCPSDPPPPPPPEPPTPAPIDPGSFPFPGLRCPGVRYTGTVSGLIVYDDEPPFNVGTASISSIYGPITFIGPNPTSPGTGLLIGRDVNGNPVERFLGGGSSGLYTVTAVNLVRADGLPDVCSENGDDDGSGGGSGGDGSGGGGSGGGGSGGDGSGGDGGSGGGGGSGGDGSGGGGVGGGDGDPSTPNRGFPGSDGSSPGDGSTPPDPNPPAPPPPRPPECPESGLTPEGDTAYDDNGGRCPLPSEGDPEGYTPRECGGRSDIGGYAVCRLREKFPFDFADVSRINFASPSCPEFYFFSQGLELCFVNSFLQAFVFIVWIAFTLLVVSNL